MSDSVIKVEGLGKKYIISHEQTRGYTTLRDLINNKVKGLIKKKEIGLAKEEFWALKDVNFEIKKGDAVGIIGRNGAGKSTLLKILSRITEPTVGRIELNGRIASLLEVGTGFHPELTGRENIFLNGAILGMSRVEIKKKFDEIVDFSGVEKFLDTPVKRYSSGMYVRLAFAVAAYLEPEILVVDEVLAVGDAEFQKKCLGKMNDVSKNEGRTVLFVSHNISAISTLCNKGILLNKGVSIYDGEIKSVISKYLSLVNGSEIVMNKILNNPKLIFNSIVIKDSTLQGDGFINIGDNLILEIELTSIEEIPKLILNTNIINSSGELVAHLVNEDSATAIENLSAGNNYIVSIIFENLMLAPGLYSIDLWAGGGYSNDVAYQYSKTVTTFEVLQGTIINRSTPYPSNALLYIESKWKINEI